ncbi:hypothetical protein [Ensifer aridi]|uniref:hypothetical protein n=1 Tax=Ensifer aridi TaxID=1708715 RepID=UPI000A10DAD0|nr:hypothetical protein [Ensifer aridi]
MKFFDRFRRLPAAEQAVSIELQAYNDRLALFSQTSSVDEVDEALRVVMASKPVSRDELAAIEAEFRRAVNDKALNHMLQICWTLDNEAHNTWRAHTEGPHLRFVYKPLLIQQYDAALELLKFVADGDDPSLVVAAYLAADAIRARLLAFQSPDLENYLIVSQHYFQRWHITIEWGLPTAKLRPGVVGKYRTSELLTNGNFH